MQRADCGKSVAASKEAEARLACFRGSTDRFITAMKPGDQIWVNDGYALLKFIRLFLEEGKR
ncbi:MAG: hypothetical protein JWM44_2554 [Bacilli bacterium]|nr:hypothetical protein [Bacilli bacterium]